MRIDRTLHVLIAICVMSVSVAAQGWVWSRDDKSKPINPQTDSISLLLLESRVPSGNNFIAKDVEVGLLLDTQFSGSTADEKTANRQFPLMFSAPTEAMTDPAHKNSKTLAFQKILVNYFPLADGKTKYTGVTVEVSLLRKQDKQVWTKVLDTLLNVTKDVTLPSPLTLGMNYLNKFSTDVLHQYLPDPNNQKRISLGSFSFIVSNDPSSLNRITKTGLHLRVLPATNAGAGWVDTSHTGNYCFYTKFDGDNWAVYVAPKDSSAADKDDDGCSKSKYTQLMNDYVPLLIEAVPKGIDKSDKRAVEMKSAGVEQCRLYHVKDENCPALKLKQ